MAICLDFDWQTNEFIVYCRSTQLREKTMLSYEQTLRLFEKWCKEETLSHFRLAEAGAKTHPTALPLGCVWRMGDYPAQPFK